MTADLSPRPSRHPSDAPLPEDRLQAVGGELVNAFRHLMASIPESTRSPTRLAKRFGMSRVIVSRLLGSLACADPLESLQRIPGPESLRVAAAGAMAAGADAAAVSRCTVAIEAFARLIRGDYGTRGSLNAAIGASRPELRASSEASARYQVYKGMRDLMGVAAEAWVMTAMLAPCVGDARSLEVVRVQGALGIGRADPLAAVHVCERPILGSTFHDIDIDLRDAGPNHAASRETLHDDTTKVHRLASDPAPRNVAVDLLTARRERVDVRTPVEATGPRLAMTITPDVPVRVLLVDVVLHESLASNLRVEIRGNERRGFDDSRGPRAGRPGIGTDTSLATELVRPGASPSPRAEWPQQGRLLERIVAELGHGSDRFTTHRLRLIHPIPGSRFDVTVSPHRPNA
jgi:hypothetical protein